MEVKRTRTTEPNNVDQKGSTRREGDLFASACGDMTRWLCTSMAHDEMIQDSQKGMLSIYKSEVVTFSPIFRVLPPLQPLVAA